MRETLAELYEENYIMIVAFSGRAGSGKDTSADFLVKNNGFVKVAFADVMKRMCLMAYPKMTLDHLWGPSSSRNAPLTEYPREHGPWDAVDRCMCCGDGRGGNKQCYLTARWALQSLGSEWGRSNYTDTWSEIVIDIYNKLCRQSGILRSVHYSYTPQDGVVVSNVPDGPRVKGVVVSDLRWPDGNEGHSIRKSGGALIKLLRNGSLSGAQAGHQSETAMDRVPDSFFDVVIDNREWTLPQLEEHLSILSNKKFRVKED